ncbi:MAG TPA: hypothetical protein VIV63_04165 [Steroidobacteraceae bacterium]
MTEPLRRMLALDGITCLLMGLVLVLAADELSKLFALPVNLLVYAGILLFPCAALMLAIAGRPWPPSTLVWMVIAGNALWVLASLVVALVLFEPSALGLSFLLLQAAVVAVLLVYELRGLKARVSVR